MVTTGSDHPRGTFAEPRGTLRNLPKGNSLRKYKGTLRNPAEPSVVTTVVTTLVAEPGGPGHSHQFFKKSKNPKQSFWGKSDQNLPKIYDVLKARGAPPAQR